jgi:hypothetical protein
MPVLYPQVERLRNSRDHLVRLRGKIEAGPAAPEDIPRTRDWVAREVLSHVVEMLPYWQGEIERILASPIEPVPFGRAPNDTIRVLTVDRDRTLPLSELYARLDLFMERIVRRLLELDERQCAKRGFHKQRGEMTIKQIVDTMLAGHLEEHCEQAAAALEAKPAASQS